ncbi:MAG: DUF2726 domain-containing protein [Clostridia bacterium]|nr:DUF2726 domain-containing protein [Clostridia bacterium]
MKKRYLQFLLVFTLGAILFALSFAINGVVAIVLRIVGFILAILSATLLIKSDEDESTQPPPVNPDYQYAVKQSLTSPSEQKLFYLLRQSVGNQYEIFPQIALVSLVDKLTAGAYRNELFRVVDFVLADPRTHKPLLVIELNDASHKRKDRQDRDAKVKCILERAGLNMLTLTTENYDKVNLRREVYLAIRK